MLSAVLVAAATVMTAGGAAAEQPQAAERPRWKLAWDGHPAVFIGRSTRIDFRLRLQADLRDSEAPTGDASGLDLARRRVGVEGRLLGVLDFELDYEIGSSQAWRDAYVNFRKYSAIRVQAGKFKLPLGLEENTSPTNLDFVHRARVTTELAPGRDRGAMVHGRLARDLVRYEIGLFDHDGRNARTSDVERVAGGATFAARAAVRPFRASRAPLADLHLGVAYTGSQVAEGFASLRGRTTLDATFFQPDYAVHGARRRTGFEARWRPGPLSFAAEYIRVTTERRGQSVGDTDLPHLIASGAYVSGTWLLTGERKASGADRPRRPVHRGGPGAIELAARLESLAFRSGAGGDAPSTSPRAEVIRGNRLRAMTLGANWYPMRGVKIQANLVRESLSEPQLGPLPSAGAFWSRVLRFQLAL